MSAARCDHSWGQYAVCQEEDIWRLRECRDFQPELRLARHEVLT